MKRTTVAGPLLLVGLALLSCPNFSGAQQKPAVSAQEIKFYDGPPTGIWRSLAVSIQTDLMNKIPGLKVSLEPGGGASNVIAVNREPALGMIMTSAAYDGYAGNPPYKGKMTNIREVAVLYKLYSIVFALADSGIQKIEDLKGKRVQLTPKGYASELISEMILQEYGITYKDISPRFLGEIEGGEALKDRHLDAFMVTAGLAYPPLLDLMSFHKVNIFGPSSDVIKRVHQKNKGLIPTSMPEGSYEVVTTAIPTVTAPCILIANEAVSAELVERVAQILSDTFDDRLKTFEFMRGLKREDLAMDVGIPFHRGAEKYYKAAGWLK